VAVPVVVYSYLSYYVQGTAMRGNCYWYKLAGGMFGYLEWGITDSVTYYSKLLNHDRIETLMLHEIIPWFSR